MYDNVIGMGVIYLTADFRLHGMSRTCCTVCAEKSTEWEVMQSRGELFTVFLDQYSGKYSPSFNFRLFHPRCQRGEFKTGRSPMSQIISL